MWSIIFKAAPFFVTSFFVLDILSNQLGKCIHAKSSDSLKKFCMTKQMVDSKLSSSFKTLYVIMIEIKN